MQVVANDVNSLTIESGTYSANENVTLVESNIGTTKYYVRNIVLSNVSSGEKAVVALKLKNNIIISKTLSPGEYFNYTPQIIVNNVNDLKFLSTKNTVDVSVLFIEKIELTDN